MKKYFDRLRRWLIMMLGGYTEQFLPAQSEIIRTQCPIVREKETRVQKVQAQVSIDVIHPDSAIDFRRYCEDQVMRLLMRELYQSDVILWDMQTNLITQKATLRATLHAVNASDLMGAYSVRGE